MFSSFFHLKEHRIFSQMSPAFLWGISAPLGITKVAKCVAQPLNVNQVLYC